MIIKYSRIPSFMFIAVSLAIGLPLMSALAKNAIETNYAWIALSIVFASILALLRGIQLLIAPPTVLVLDCEGIHVYYKFGRSFTKDADLLPWKLIEKMQIIRVHGKDNSFNWAIEILLSAPPCFDTTKRNALQWTITGPSDPNAFYLDTFVLDLSREKALSALQASWHKWQGNAGR
ncbi:hypothetical protein KP005_01315 [Geomonas nitrogeniifigens]|uniref:Toxin CptA n=1 Tax=Geomonas diazotrophica TaxID=2843197 RepID=A0ABX8JRE3_9BACT|nr:hypothetical protein [Geomonas nitrogeniifigens]QWV97965.1 hypothetical protein KP005_01315 [Geomonas nitrogeniifigens]